MYSSFQPQTFPTSILIMKKENLLNSKFDGNALNNHLNFC